MSRGLIRIYLDYVATRDDPDPKVSANANECLLNCLTLYAEHRESEQNGWILLYCYYRRFNYAPGYSYASWHLDNFVKEVKGHSSPAPYSLWGISLNMNPRFEHNRSHTFFDCIRIFVRLGLYEFAQVIWEEVRSDCSQAQNYMITTQLKILLDQLPDDFETKTFTFESTEDQEDQLVRLTNSCLATFIDFNSISILCRPSLMPRSMAMWSIIAVISSSLPSSMRRL